MLPTFQHKEPDAGSSKPSRPLDVFEIQSKAASQDTSSWPEQNKAKQLDNCLSERIERFDFKSLARECMSSSSLYQSNLNSSNVLSATGSKQFVSKLDYEAVRTKERRKRGEETDSDIEKEEEKMKARLTMIERATPIPLDISEPKMELLEYLGITSWKRKKGKSTLLGTSA